MAKLSKAEVAAKCGLHSRTLAIYIQRGKININEAGEVDDSDSKNFMFIEKYARKSEAKGRLPQKQNIDRSPRQEHLLSNGNLETRKLTAQVNKMEQEIEKISLNNQKMKGLVLPVYVIDGLFLQYGQSILTESKNTLKDILTIFRKKRDLTPPESSEISSEFTDALNDMMRRAAEDTVRNLEVMVSEFSIKRSVGERDQ